VLAVGYLRHQVSTTIHKFWVARNLAVFVVDDYVKALLDPMCDWPPLDSWLDLGKRALRHDLSKYRWDEASAFARTGDRLRHSTYGTDEYRALLREIKPAITRHYERNRHHPEFWPNGFKDMNEADVIEMVADWGAAVRRHADGDLDKSIVQNAERFGYDRETEKFLRSTAHRMRLL